MAKRTQAEYRSMLQPATSELVGGILRIVEGRLTRAGVGKLSLDTQHLEGPLWVLSTYMLFTDEYGLAVGPSKLFNPAAQAATIAAIYAAIADPPTGSQAVVRVVRNRSGALATIWTITLEPGRTGSAVKYGDPSLLDPVVKPGDRFLLHTDAIGSGNPGGGLEVWIVPQVDVQKRPVPV